MSKAKWCNAIVSAVLFLCWIAEFGGLLSCMSTDQEDLSLLTGHLEDVLKYAYVQYMLRVVLKITQIFTLFLGILQKMKLVFLVMTVILHQRLVKTGLLFNTISIASVYYTSMA